MSENVVSLFFLGTACHRSSYQDALTHFFKIISENNTAARLFDGVGSSADNPEETAKNPPPGQYIYNPENDEKKCVTGKILQSIRNFMHKLQGLLVGEGMDEQLFEALIYIEEDRKSTSMNSSH